MSLVDSLDSVLMLYAYASPQRNSPEGKLSVFYRSENALPPLISPIHPRQDTGEEAVTVLPTDEEVEVDVDRGKKTGPKCDANVTAKAEGEPTVPLGDMDAQPMDYHARKVMDAKASTMSSLSITLTVLSIIVALR
jgi:high-affinity nickel-transport protein